MIFEVCTDSYEGTLLAQKHGAKRIELCSALSVGGLSPSLELTKKCLTIKNIEVHVMVRPTEGNFVYSKNEMEIMEKEIQTYGEAGVSGVVFGCLNADNTINIQQNITLVEAARNFGMECTFHRAFDFVTKPLETLESLINIGFNRLLTSGGKPKAIEGVELIKKLVEMAKGEIEIMAGSGVNSSNALQLSQSGIDALHFTSHKSNDTSNSLGMGSRNIPDPDKIQSIITLF